MIVAGINWDALGPAGAGVALFALGVLLGATITLRLGRLVVQWVTRHDRQDKSDPDPGD